MIIKTTFLIGNHYLKMCFSDEAPGVRASRARQDFEWDDPVALRLSFESSTAVKAHHTHEQIELPANRANRASSKATRLFLMDP